MVRSVYFQNSIVSQQGVYISPDTLVLTIGPRFINSSFPGKCDLKITFSAQFGQVSRLTPVLNHNHDYINCSCFY